MPKRDTQEILDAFKSSVARLERHCLSFDDGIDDAAIDIAVALRTLLYTRYDENGIATSLSLMDTLKGVDSKYDIMYLSTCIDKPSKPGGVHAWHFKNLRNMSILDGSDIYAGIIVKTLDGDVHGKCVADVKYRADGHPHIRNMVTLQNYLSEKIFFDVKTKIELSRIEAIKYVANKDAGAHFDTKIPKKYDSFRHPNAFKVIVNGEDIPFSRNPVYVSIRQIAWEVLESFKQYNLIFGHIS